jgi:hypothetical protein
MKKFILRFVLFLSPLLLLIFAFVIFDPFAMFRSPTKYNVSSSMNDDANTFRIFDTYNDSLKFNAFIMGNSKTLAILSSDWKKHIGQNNRVFKFGSPGESLLNIRKKLEYAAAKGNKLDHVLLLLDNKLLMNTDNNLPDLQGPVYLKSNKSSYNNSIEYFGKGFYYFLYDGYFYSYFKDINTKEEISSSKTNINFSFINKLMGTEEFVNLYKGNEFYRWELEEQIQNDSINWVNNYRKNSKSNVDLLSRISETDYEHLKAIKALFIKYNTKYFIINAPEYQCGYGLSNNVLKQLKELFSQNAVINDDFGICENPYYFYDPTHFRPVVGSFILKTIYN